MPVSPRTMYEKDRGLPAPVPILIEPDPDRPKRVIYRYRDQTFRSWRSLLRETQGVQGHMSTDQYCRPRKRPGFGRTQWGFTVARSQRALDRAEATIPAKPEVTVLEAVTHGWWAERIDARLTVPEAGQVVAVSPAVTLEPVLGIDLGRRHNEVAKLLFAGFGPRIFGMGFDPDDVLQEVYKGILIRNRGRCAFDPRKASFGHYVHMVCGCVLSNYQRAQGRVRRFEQVGIAGFAPDGDWQADGIDLSNLPDPKAVTDGMADALIWEDFLTALRGSREGRPHDRDVAVSIVPLVRQGLGRKEIAAIMGLHRAVVSKALSLLRRVALVWQEALGISPALAT